MSAAPAKRNLWPFGIIAAFAIFIPATTGLIVLAVSHKEDLVRADYYEQEIRFQGQLDRLARTRALGNRTSVTFDPAEHRISIALPAEHAGRLAAGHIQLYRPSAAEEDRQIELKPDANGIQTLDARDLSAGLWKVRVSWTVDNQEYLIDQSVTNLAATPSMAKPR